MGFNFEAALLEGEADWSPLADPGLLKESSDFPVAPHAAQPEETERGLPIAIQARSASE